MAYPTVNAPYGFRPVNLIGGQVFAGSTRNMPISYGWANSDFFYGDFIVLNDGYVVNGGNELSAFGTDGLFLGCSYTSPATKQKLWSQYWPAGTLAGDGEAIICDDPDTVFKTAVVTVDMGNVIGSASSLLLGQNMAGSNGTGSTTTGNSGGGVIGDSVSAGNFRVMGLVPETQITTAAAYVSGTGTTSLHVSGLVVGTILPIGTDIFNNINGQRQFTGSTLTAAVTVTSATNQVLTVTASTVAVSGNLTLVQTPEVLVKITFGSHRYYTA